MAFAFFYGAKWIFRPEMTVTEFSAVAALEFRNVKKGIESFSRVKFISCRTKFRFISLARANFWTFLINKS